MEKSEKPIRAGRHMGGEHSFRDRDGKESPAVCVLSVMSDGQDWSCNWDNAIIEYAKTHPETQAVLYKLAWSVKDSLDNLFGVQ